MATVDSNACNSSMFNSSQRSSILTTMTVTASVSLIMCVFTVTLVVCLRLHKHFIYRLASYQVLSSMFFSISLILQLSQKFWEIDHTICEVFGFLLQYFMWVKLLFTVCLVFHFFVLAVYLKNLYKFELLYVLVSILLPMLVVWIPFVGRKYGEAGAWCWIKDWKDNCAQVNDVIGVVEQFVLWYTPLFMSLTISIVIAVFILIILTRRGYASAAGINQSETGPLMYSTIQAETKNIQAALKQLLPLLAYPIIFYVLAIIPFINRIYDVVHSDVNYPLALAHVISISSWGFFSSCALLVHIRIVKKKMHHRKKQFIYNSNPSTFQTGGYAEGIGERLESSVAS